MWLWNLVDFLWSVAVIIFFIDLIIMLPLSLFKKTRLFASKSIFYSSYFFGFMLWIECVFYTFDLWGIIALIIGLLIIGIGVVPMAFLALAINSMWDAFFTLLITLVVIMVVRFLGAYLLERFESDL